MSPRFAAGHRDVHLDDRFEQRRLGLLEHVAEGHRAGRLERRFRAVDGVVLAEVDFDAHVLHLIAGDHAAFDPLLESLFHRRQEVAGNRAADDRVDPEEIVLRIVVSTPSSRGNGP